MKRLKLAALAVAITLACSGIAAARDHDNDRWQHDRNHDRGAHNGWFHHDNDHDRNDRWRRDREHERWEREHSGWNRGNNGGYYGNYGNYRYPGSYGYPGTYGYGYPGSYGGYGSPGSYGGYGYPGTYGGYGYPGTYGNYGRNGSPAYNIGYQDGARQARSDVNDRKPFNPYPRGASHGTHGYNPAYGDVGSYQQTYTAGYRAGYQANFQGGYRGWGF